MSFVRLCVISVLLIFQNNGQNRFSLLSSYTSALIFSGGHHKDSLIAKNNLEVQLEVYVVLSELEV